MTRTGNNTVCDINTIPGTYQRLREEGNKVSMNTLRGWVRNGTLPAALCGEKRPRALISYANVMRILREGTPR